MVATVQIPTESRQELSVISLRSLNLIQQVVAGLERQRKGVQPELLQNVVRRHRDWQAGQLGHQAPINAAVIRVKILTNNINRQFHRVSM